MILKLSQISKIDNLLNELKTVRFNSILPVNIKVEKLIKEDPLGGKTYLLEVGKKELPTKSLKELDVGKNYWGVIKEDIKSNNITLSQLLKKPHILQKYKRDNFVEVKPEQLVKFLSEKRPKQVMKELLQEKLSKATTKSDFFVTSSMINALNDNIFTFVLNNNNQKTLFQFKKSLDKKDSDKKESEKLEFYAAFENLGPMEGNISVFNKEKELHLNLFYQESLDFLKKELNNLDFKGILYKKSDQIKPLYEFTNSLLDLKG